MSSVILFAILFAVALLLIALLVTVRLQQSRRTWFTKPMLSALFILAAWLQPVDFGFYHCAMLTGFIFCFWGDVLLIPDSKRTFQWGLVSFLLGHLVYVAAFVSQASVDLNLIWIVLATVLVTAAAYIWLREHLGNMQLPVLCYMVAISLMVISAGAVLLNQQIASPARWLIFGGAVSFYVSDLLVAREQFVVRSYSNRLIGLPLYYAGQFLLAFSLGAV